MAIVINGSGTVTGLAVGGLPDGTVDAGTLATDSVTAAKLEVSAITGADLPAGSVLQVVSVANGTTESSTSGSWVAHSGLTAAITPSASSNKILVTIAFSYRTANGTNNFNSAIYRGSTNLGHATHGFGTMFDGNSYYQGHATLQFLDSPSTTSATTYQLYYKGSTTTTINTDSGVGTITLMEIAV